MALADDPRGVLPPRTRAGGRVASPLSPIAPPSSQGPLPAPPPAVPDPSLDTLEARRSSARRGVRLGLAAAVGLGLLGLLDSLPVLFLSIATGQLLLAGIAKRRPPNAVFGSLRVELTPLGRFVFPATWALVLGAIFVESAPFRWLATLLLAGAAATWPAARANLSRIQVARTLERRARAGAPTSLEVRFHNPTPRPASAIATRDALGVYARPSSLEVAVDGVAGSSEVAARTTVTFERRGLRRLRALRVASRYPLGLVQATFDTVAEAETLVRPREGRATPRLARRLGGDVSEAARSRRPAAGGDEPFGLRDWREGDDPRRIHWRTTARRGTRTFVERRDPTCRRIAVVLGRGHDKTPEGDRSFERAVSVAATVLRAAQRSGASVHLVTGGGGERPGEGLRVEGRRELEAALDQLAVVRGDGGRAPAAALAALRRRHHDLLVVRVLCDEEPAGSDAPGWGAPLDLRADRPQELLAFVRGLP